MDPNHPSAAYRGMGIRGSSAVDEQQREILTLSGAPTGSEQARSRLAMAELTGRPEEGA